MLPTPPTAKEAQRWAQLRALTTTRPGVTMVADGLIHPEVRALPLAEAIPELEAMLTRIGIELPAPPIVAEPVRKTLETLQAELVVHHAAQGRAPAAKSASRPTPTGPAAPAKAEPAPVQPVAVDESTATLEEPKPANGGPVSKPIQWFDRLFEEPGLTNADIVVGSYLFRRAMGKHWPECWPEQEAIALAGRVTTKTVQRSLARMRRKNMVAWDQRRRSSNGLVTSLANKYRLLPPEGWRKSDK